ncbi:alcohol-forming fatty acyl-CoA reductase-like [Gossypium australe]|uniref:Alcohol-forming fatty acyl-CoA reductase-like n=1 Tax=Gossypium australe TaxID=47621 RepID=A0A5B6VBH0_9ROSI|nr:alcohol-forming fatty acyl-CoA reductase-like [Gossypium australe]
MVSPLGQFVVVNKIYRQCPLEVQDYLSNVIFAIIAERMARKGCEAYLAYVLDTNVSSFALSSIRTIKEFLYAFPKELPVIPPKH